MKAKIKDHFTKITNQRVYPATSEHANIGKSINRVKTEDILFDFVSPDWLKEEWYNMIIHFEERLFMVRSNDFDFVDTKCPECSTGTMAGKIEGVLSNGERCDTCEKFSNDQEAQKAIAENDPELDKLNMDCGGSNARSKILTNE
jgi:hypothetical protein